MDLSIIIINWKSVTYLRNCLKSIFQHTHDFEFEVIVVDNNSGDGCCAMMMVEFPVAKCIESRENLGFARANNLGYSHSSGKALLFLNPDTEIRGNAIGVLYSTLISSPKIGAVGGTLLNTDLTIQTSSILPFPTLLRQVLDIEWLKMKFPASNFWGIKPLFQKQKKPIQVEAVSGACLMVKREIFIKIGEFSSDYFMYAEDIDLCFKIHGSGSRVLFVNSAHIVHHGGGSTKKNLQKDFNNIMMREANLIFLEKYHSNLYALAYRFTTALAAILRLFILSFAIPLFGPAGVKKWFGILRWAVGLEPWAERLQFGINK